MKLIEKSYKIDLSKIEEGYLYSDIYAHSNDRNKARYKLLSLLKYENISLKGDKEITYSNIPIIRDPEGDIINVNGKNYTREKYHEIEKELEHDQKQLEILKNDDITHCYIKKRGIYYRENRCGYTENIIYAGVYKKEDAVKEALGTIEITAIPIDKKEHNNYLSNVIKKIKENLL